MKRQANLKGRVLTWERVDKGFSKRRGYEGGREKLKDKGVRRWVLEREGRFPKWCRLPKVVSSDGFTMIFTLCTDSKHHNVCCSSS